VDSGAPLRRPHLDLDDPGVAGKRAVDDDADAIRRNRGERDPAPDQIVPVMELP
jgi:hypothetical protein